MILFFSIFVGGAVGAFVRDWVNPAAREFRVAPAVYETSQPAPVDTPFPELMPHTGSPESKKDEDSKSDKKKDQKSEDEINALPIDDAVAEPAPAPPPKVGSSQAPADKDYAFVFEKLRRRVEEWPGTVTVAFTDLRTGHGFSINGDRLIPSASVIKVPVMVAVFREAEAGRIKLTQKIKMRGGDKLGGSGKLRRARSGTAYSVRQLLHYMIGESDNTATYMLVQKIGKETVNKHMRALGLNRTHIEDATCLVRDADEWVNVTTALEMNLLLEKIARRQAASTKSCREMVAIMRDQHYQWGIPAALPSKSMAANKTGFLDNVLNDVAIVNAPHGYYVLSVFVSKVPDMIQSREIIRNVSSATYHSFATANRDIAAR